MCAATFGVRVRDDFLAISSDQSVDDVQLPGLNLSSGLLLEVLLHLLSKHVLQLCHALTEHSDHMCGHTITM